MPLTRIFYYNEYHDDWKAVSLCFDLRHAVELCRTFRFNNIRAYILISEVGSIRRTYKPTRRR